MPLDDLRKPTTISRYYSCIKQLKRGVKRAFGCPPGVTDANSICKILATALHEQLSVLLQECEAIPE